MSVKIKNKALFASISAVIILACAMVILTFTFKSKITFIPEMENVEIIHYNEQKNIAEIKINIKNNHKDGKCIISKDQNNPQTNDQEIPIENNSCQFEINVEQYYLFIKNGKTISKSYDLLKEIQKTTAIS